MCGGIGENVNPIPFFLYFAAAPRSTKNSAQELYLIATTRKKRGVPLAAVAER